MRGRSNGSETLRLIELAQNLLHYKDYSGCRKYAFLAQQSDPQFPGAAHILAVAYVLDASTFRVNDHHSWYSILQVPTLAQDLELIRKQHMRLLQLVKPTGNRFRYAEDAFKLVSNAWFVLSNPIKKSLFDLEFSLFAEVSKNESQQNPVSDPDGTFGPLVHTVTMSMSILAFIETVVSDVRTAGGHSKGRPYRHQRLSQVQISIYVMLAFLS